MCCDFYNRSRKQDDDDQVGVVEFTTRHFDGILVTSATKFRDQGSSQHQPTADFKDVLLLLQLANISGQQKLLPQFPHVSMMGS